MYTLVFLTTTKFPMSITENNFDAARGGGAQFSDLSNFNIIKNLLLSSKPAKMYFFLNSNEQINSKKHILCTYEHFIAALKFL